MVNPAFLKIGLGGAVVTGAGTTGIVYKNQIKDFFVKHFSSTTSTYVIVKTTAATDSDIEKKLYDENKKTKNFDCIVTSNKNLKDENCELFEITAPQTNKLNNLNDIKNSTTQVIKNNITTNTFFKLTISDSVLGTAWDGTQTVDIVSKTENKSDNTKKKYGTFTLQYKVTEVNDNISIIGKTNWVIGKITGTPITNNISSATNLNCNISDETPSNPSKACSIFKINNPPADIKTLTTTDIVDPTTNKDDYAANKYFIIDLKRTTKKDISDLTKKTITINVTKTDSSTEQVGVFSVVTALIDDSQAFTKASKTIILS